MKKLLLITLGMLMGLLTACNKDERLPEIKDNQEIIDVQLFALKYLPSVTQQGVALKYKLWQPGQTIKIKFLNGTDTQKNFVKNNAAEWMNYANIVFDYVAAGNADVKIKFANNTSNITWSYTGIDAIQIAQDEPTMVFTGIMAGNTAKANVKMMFGHMLGLVPEHKNHNASIPFDIEMVYEYYINYEEWTEEEVNNFFFQHYTSSIANYTEYDPLSIMVWPIEDFLTTNGVAIERNNELSDMDKQFIGELYPFPIRFEVVSGSVNYYFSCTDKYDNFYFIDRFSNKDMVKKIDVETGQVSTMVERIKGTSNGDYSSAWGIAVDGNGSIFLLEKLVAGPSNAVTHKVGMYDHNGNFVKYLPPKPSDNGNSLIDIQGICVLDNDNLIVTGQVDCPAQYFYRLSSYKYNASSNDYTLLAVYPEASMVLIPWFSSVAKNNTVYNSISNGEGYHYSTLNTDNRAANTNYSGGYSKDSNTLYISQMTTARDKEGGYFFKTKQADNFGTLYSMGIDNTMSPVIDIPTSFVTSNGQTISIILGGNGYVPFTRNGKAFYTYAVNTTLNQNVIVKVILP